MLNLPANLKDCRAKYSSVLNRTSSMC